MKIKKEGDRDIAWIWSIVTEIEYGLEPLKYQLNSLHLSSTTLTDLEAGYWVHLKPKFRIDYTNITTLTKVTKIVVYVKI